MSQRTVRIVAVCILAVLVAIALLPVIVSAR